VIWLFCVLILVSSCTMHVNDVANETTTQVSILLAAENQARDIGIWGLCYKYSCGDVNTTG
jgi:hypothetical protein